MPRRSRLSAPIPTLMTVAAAGLVLATVWGAQPTQTAPAAQSAPEAPEPPAPDRQRVKPSDPPNLALFFTDQVVGYIQPCG